MYKNNFFTFYICVPTFNIIEVIIKNIILLSNISEQDLKYKFNVYIKFDGSKRLGEIF